MLIPVGRAISVCEKGPLLERSVVDVCIQTAQNNRKKALQTLKKSADKQNKWANIWLNK